MLREDVVNHSDKREYPSNILHFEQSIAGTLYVALTKDGESLAI